MTEHPVYLVAAFTAGVSLTLIAGSWVNPARILPFIVVVAVYLLAIWWGVQRLAVHRERNRAIRDCVSAARQLHQPVAPVPGALRNHVPQ